MAACPFHARVFNWWDPTFPKGTQRAFNPDVSTRMRGVVEKCSFCNHRYQRAKEKAMLEGRTVLHDGEYIPACAEACPTGAISFGNLRDSNSKVSKLVKSPFAFRLLEKYGTEPSVYYITRQAWIREEAERYFIREIAKKS